MYLIKSGSIFDVTGGREKEFLSPFAEELFQRDSQSWEHEAWKCKDDEVEAEKGIVPRSMLWGGRAKINKPARVKAAFIAAVPGRLYYVLEMTNSSGLFYYDIDRDHEIRLFHRTDFRPRGLFVGEDFSLLTTVANADGTVHLVHLDPDGKREKVLTSGDCIDENPFQRGPIVYYQSAGIARNPEGALVAIGPAAICALDLASGELETVLESDKYDYLLPRVAADGSLFAIQVPYQGRPSYPLTARLVDIVMFPWRLAVAVFAFLNVFSMFFAKKPLTMAGGPAQNEMDVSRRVLHNRVINIQETMRRERRKVAVSRDWKLVRYAAGRVTEIASNVLWFEVDPNGAPVYTNGYEVFDTHGVKHMECDELVSGFTLAPSAVATPAHK